MARGFRMGGAGNSTTPKGYISKGGKMYYAFAGTNATITAESDRVDVYLGGSANFTIANVDVTGYSLLSIYASCSAAGTSLQLSNNGAYTSSQIPTTKTGLTVSLSGLTGVQTLTFVSTSASKTYSFYEIRMM